MNKIVFASLMVLVVNTLFAQARFGVKAGPNLANWTVKENGEKDDEYQSRLGFHFGLVADFAFSEKFSIQPHVLYVNKGTSIDHGDHKDQSSINSIDIPVNFLYKAPTANGKFFIGAGPNLGFNLSGKVKSDEEDEDGDKIEIGSDPGQVKAFDFGLNFLAGYEFKSGFFVSANFTPGITNLANIPSSLDYTERSSYLGISVGYFFGGKTTAKK